MDRVPGLAVGIADTELSEAERHLQHWLDKGYQGEMSYMARHGSKRTRPGELMPGTLRVISVRMDYFPPDCTPVEAVLDNPALGFISRYALGRDYQAPSLLVGHSLGGAAVLAAAPQLASVEAVVTIGSPATASHVTHLFAGARDTLAEEGETQVQIGGRAFCIRQQFLDDLDQYADALNIFLQEWIAPWGVEELFHEGQKRRICFAPAMRYPCS